MPFDRQDALRRLADEPFDVLVVGGGITGAGCALDAAARGLRTALVDKDDFASGTSSKSSKFVHGGLRYLQQREIGLVYDALRERHLLLRNAPHLVSTLPFLLPVFHRGGVVPRRVARVLGASMWGYDLTGGLRIGHLHRRLTRAEALAHVPTLPRERIDSAYLYYDARADDARLTLAVLRTAVLAHGAVAANGARAVALLHDPRGRVCGATVEADGRRLDVRAPVVINAGGVWADDVRALDEPGRPSGIRQAKGVHVVIPWQRVRADVAVVLPVPKDRRSIFVAPWGTRAYVGTTDEDDDTAPDQVRADAADVDYLLRALNAALTEPVGPADVLGTWAGQRPLVRASPGGRTADLSRRHRVEVSASGLVSVVGGKLTTYRRMAADTVDAALRVLGEQAPRAVARHSPTARLRLLGADGHESLARSGDPVRVHLAARYGGQAAAVLALTYADPSLLEPLVAGLPYLRAEAVYAVTEEMARGVDDVLSRRTRARLEDARAAAAAADEVARLIAGPLGLSAEQAAAQAEAFRAAVAADLAAVPA